MLGQVSQFGPTLYNFCFTRAELEDQLAARRDHARQHAAASHRAQRDGLELAEAELATAPRAQLPHLDGTVVLHLRFLRSI